MNLGNAALTNDVSTDKEQLQQQLIANGVRLSYFNNDWPLIITVDEATAADTEKSASWMAANKATIDQLLLLEGAIYIRGLNVRDTSDFEAVIKPFPAQNIDYVGGFAPRGNADGRSYESTKWPKELPIPLHQEMAYMHKSPNKLCFCCLIAPQKDGETTIGQARKLAYDTLDPTFLAKLREKGLSYNRNLRDKDYSFGDSAIDAVHVDWQTQFQTDSREEVEKILTEHGYEFIWEENDSLTFSWKQPAYRQHRITGEEIYFTSLHGAQTSAAMFGSLYEEKLKDFYASYPYPKPLETTFSDGEKLGQENIDAVTKLYKDVEVKVPYEQGDILLVDNQLSLHGRNTFEGDRLVRVTFVE